MTVVLDWLVSNTAGNFIVDTLFAVPAILGYVKLHRKMDRHHQWHLDQHKGD